MHGHGGGHRRAPRAAEEGGELAGAAGHHLNGLADLPDLLGKDDQPACVPEAIDAPTSPDLERQLLQTRAQLPGGAARCGANRPLDVRLGLPFILARVRPP
jgi:hypothetical protein